MQVVFKSIRFGLIVGIGGGVPSEEVDIRLGDVVVGQPNNTLGGVVQYDSGKATPSGFEKRGHLNSPPKILLHAIQLVRADADLGRSTLLEHLAELEKTPKFTRQNAGTDVLYQSTYDHEGGGTCKSCSSDQEVDRKERVGEEVVVHYGTVASGNQVMRHGIERDKVSAEFGGVMCFEMEAAGLMNSFPCLVIRGICDYADSHKNKRWQPYAAGVAAAYAKEVLMTIPLAEVAQTGTVDDGAGLTRG
jgi:nucleoside phosphorylase